MNMFWLLLGMTLVTALPRIVPAFFINKIRFNHYFERFLKLVPYTAMAALIFPGVFSMDPTRWYVGMIGAVVAIVLSLLKSPSGVVVFVTVLTVYFAFY